MTFRYESITHLSVRTRGDVELLLGPGHVVAGVVGADHHVSLGVTAAALDEVQLEPVDGDRVARVVRTSQGLLPAAERHLQILE